MGLRNYTLTVKRHSGAGSYNASGLWVESGTSSFTISASVQPAKPEEMQMLPEARRRSIAFRVYTSTELKVANDTTKVNADLVTINSEDYEVAMVGHWQNNIISHYKAICVKI